jgi:hypothetical protein
MQTPTGREIRYTPEEEAKIAETKRLAAEKAAKEKEEEDHTQLVAAYSFLRHHLDIIPCPENALALTKWIAEHNLPFREENLEKAYAEIHGSLKHGDVPPPAPAAKAEPSPWSSLSKADVAAMRHDVFRKNLKDPVFVARLKELGIV